MRGLKHGRAVLGALLLLLCLPAAVRADDAAEAEVVRLEVPIAFGSTRTLFLEGRALEGAPPPPASRGDSLWRNVRRLASGLESDEVAGLPLVVSVGARKWRLRTDEEGFFRIALDAPEGERWNAAAPPRIRVGPAEGGGRYRVEPQTLVAAIVPEGSLVIVSDIDDTILDTGVTDRSRMVRRTVTRNAATLQDIPGMSALYRELLRPPSNVRIIAYVSGSPVNLHNRLRQFLDDRRFPPGPLFLKNVGFLKDDALHEQVRYKSGRLDWIAARLPGTRFLLFGDDGEADPVIYDTFRRTHPGRVAAAFLRRVPEAGESEELPGGLHRIRDAAEGARILHAAGLLSEEARDRVLSETGAAKAQESSD